MVRFWLIEAALLAMCFRVKTDKYLELVTTYKPKLSMIMLPRLDSEKLCQQKVRIGTIVVKVFH